VLLVVLLVAAGKVLIFGGLTRAFGYHDLAPLAVGLGLFQIGEFAFVLARVGLAQQAIGRDLYALVLSTALITMILTPFAARCIAPLGGWLRRLGLTPTVPAPLPADHALQDHIIIAGYGRVGHYTADVLQRLKLPCVVVELDQRQADQARAAGLTVVYGDASSPVILEAAGVHAARLLLVAVSSAIDVELIARSVRQTRPNLHVVARAARRAQIETLHAIGIHEIVQPEFEAGLEMVRQSLLHFDIPAPEIERLSDSMRDELYQPSQTLHADAALLARLRRARRALEIEWFTLPADAILLGQRIDEAALRQRTGASIVAILRDEGLVSNPGPDTILEAGDTIGVLGTTSQRDAFGALLAPADRPHTQLAAPAPA
jgi:K+:H+ antiporter